MINFILVEEDNLDIFVTKIETLLNCGYELHGYTWSNIGPETNKYQGKTIYYQALICKE